MVGILQYRLDYRLRGIFRNRSWLHPLVPRYGTLQFFGSSHGHRHCCHRQLGCQFHRRSYIPPDSGLTQWKCVGGAYLASSKFHDFYYRNI